MNLLGAYYRSRFSTQGLLHDASCGDANRIYIRADTDERTVESARALANTLLAGCRIAVHSAPPGERDSLFSPPFKPDTTLAAKAMEGRRDVQQSQEAMPALAGVLGNRDDPPADIAATLAEDLLLEYTNGMRGENLGWGRLNALNLGRILELHAAHADMTRRTPYLARVRGSNLLAHVLASMEQAATGTAVPGALGEPGEALQILMGHDTNISNISGMLGLSWHLHGYPDNETPPGGALVFSLWVDATRRRIVRTEYLSQTLDQMHDLVPLTLSSPPAIENVRVPGCEAPDCPWDAFERVLEKAIDPRFVVTETNHQM
jgi:4-phytase/acid phosphatase